MKRSHTLIGSSCLAILFAGTDPAFAEEGGSPLDGGPVLTFGISALGSATDNYSLRPIDGDHVNSFAPGVSFSYVDRRPNDVLSLALDGIEIGQSRNRSRARIDYDREGLNSAFSFGTEYSSAPVNADSFDTSPFFDSEPLQEADLVQDQGDRQQLSARFYLQARRNDPIGFTLEGRYRDQRYLGTTDPNLFDTEDFDLTGAIRFTFSPVTEGRMVLRYEGYTSENEAQTQRQTSSATLGLTQAFSSIDNLDISLGFQNIETAETLLGTRSSDHENSIVGHLKLSRELPRGTVGTSLELNGSVNGDTATWLVDRELRLPRGHFDISLGATRDVAGTVHPVGRVSFLQKMLRSTLRASLSQQVSSSLRSNELLTTEASLGYKYEINSRSDLDFSVNYAALDQAGGPTVNDVTRTDLRATYSHALTRDWQLTSGYEHRLRKESDLSDATSNRFFIKLQRDFILRP